MKAFENIQQLFMIKTLNKMVTEGIILYIVKFISKPRKQLYSVGKSKLFPLSFGTIPSCSLSQLLYNIVLILVIAIGQRNDIKDIQSQVITVDDCEEPLFQ